MDIKKLLSENAALTEAALPTYLETEDAALSTLYEAMRYSTLGGGKRIRATLVLEFSRLFGGTDEAALPFACAMECVHASSLIHDDMPCMDNDAPPPSFSALPPLNISKASPKAISGVILSHLKDVVNTFLKFVRGQYFATFFAEFRPPLTQNTWLFPLEIECKK